MTTRARSCPTSRNKGKAYLDGIRWEAILEAAQRAVRIENAEIDTLRNPALQDVARLETNPDLSVSSFSEPSGYILSTNFERTDLDFHELAMRQAISHAIDRQAIVTALLADLGSPLYGPITPADVFYDPAVEEFNQFDLDQAKSMVAELGWTPGDDGILTKNGVRHAFSLVVQAESFNRDLASVLQASLAELGMEVTIEALDRRLLLRQARPRGADSSLFYYLWPVPIDVVILFVGSGTIPGAQLEPRQAPGRRRGHRRLEAGGQRRGAGGGGEPVPVGGRRATADDPAGRPQQRLGLAAERPRLAAAPVRHLPALQRCLVESIRSSAHRCVEARVGHCASTLASPPVRGAGRRSSQVKSSGFGWTSRHQALSSSCSDAGWMSPPGQHDRGPVCNRTR